MARHSHLEQPMTATTTTTTEGLSAASHSSLALASSDIQPQTDHILHAFRVSDTAGTDNNAFLDVLEAAINVPHHRHPHPSSDTELRKRIETTSLPPPVSEQPSLVSTSPGPAWQPPVSQKGMMDITASTESRSKPPPVSYHSSHNSTSSTDAGLLLPPGGGPSSSSSRPTRRNTTGSTPLGSQRPHASPHVKAASQPMSLDDAALETAVGMGEGSIELANDIERHAERIRRERMSKRAKEAQRQEAEAAMTAAAESAAEAQQGPHHHHHHFHAHTPSQLDKDVPLVGNLIGEDHVNYVLMYNMLTGIRIGVRRFHSCNLSADENRTIA